MMLFFSCLGRVRIRAVRRIVIRSRASIERRGTYSLAEEFQSVREDTTCPIPPVRSSSQDSVLTYQNLDSHHRPIYLYLPVFTRSKESNKKALDIFVICTSQRPDIHDLKRS
ncbi:hypothetical protein MRB53_040492 [Persea americana]|nr:hypothetical protein MRB53_040492 [Persea americana]